VVGVERWAEIRRLHRVERLSIREISKRTGSKLDPFKDWICEQLAADPKILSQRLREIATELEPRVALGQHDRRTVRLDAIRAGCGRPRPSLNSDHSNWY
jgi:hypothetical protein